MRRPRILTTEIDDAMREKWWELNQKHGLVPKLIGIRFGIAGQTVSKYLRERRVRDGVEPPAKTH